MDILGIIWDLLMWGIGIFCTVITFGVGMLFSMALYGAADFLGRSIRLNLSRSLVDFGLRVLLFISMMIFALSVKVPLSEVFKSLITIGNFDELTTAYYLGQDQFILNNMISVAWGQLMLTFIFFLPYFFMTEGINLIKLVLCDEKEEFWYSCISYFPELLTVLASSVIVLYMGDGLAVRLLEFIQSINIRFGLVYMLFNMLLFCFYMYRVICDMFGSDVFLTMMGANVAAMILGVQLTGGMHTVIIILCYVIGYLSKTVRSGVVSAFSGLNHAGIMDGYSVLYGIVSVFLTTGIFMIVLKVMGC